MPGTENQPRRLWLWVLVPLFVLGMTSTAHLDTPGVYPDAVNPDFLAVKALGSATYGVPRTGIPGNLLDSTWPVMRQVYHGALPFWIGLPIYALVGTDVVGIRLTHAFFAALIVLAAFWLLKALRVRPWLGALVLTVMALDPAFVLQFRTQFVITVLPVSLLLVALALAWRCMTEPCGKRLLIIGGLAAGLSVYGYFHYAFFVLALGLALVARLRSGAAPWAVGLALGALPILAGWGLAALNTGDFGALWEEALARGTLRDSSDPVARIGSTIGLISFALDGTGISRMFFDNVAPEPFAPVKIAFIILLPVVVAGLLEVRRRSEPQIRLMMLVSVVPPLAYGVVFGDRLWAHHFAPMVPLLYCAAGVVLMRVLAISARRSIAAGLVGVLASVVALNALSFGQALKRLEVTGGSGYFSTAINEFSAAARADQALYVLPDWGLFMPFQMISSGDTQFLARFAGNEIDRALCGGRDVVLASMVSNEVTSHEQRIVQVRWAAPHSTVFADRLGQSVILVARWDGQNCSMAVEC